MLQYQLSVRDEDQRRLLWRHLELRWHHLECRDVDRAADEDLVGVFVADLVEEHALRERGVRELDLVAERAQAVLLFAGQRVEDHRDTLLLLVCNSDSIVATDLVDHFKKALHTVKFEAVLT